MSKVEWCDGLSTGVTEIDNDHKKILSLINKLSDAIDSQHTQQVVGDIFEQLEQYIAQHFAQEEDLLRRCNYAQLDEHIVSHQQFILKISELKKLWGTSNSRQLAEEICQFLIDWVIKHIVAEDLPYVPTLNEHGIGNNIDKNRQNKFNRLAKWLSRHVVLSKRIVLTALLPFIGIAVLSALMIGNSVNKLNSIHTLDALARLTTHTGEVVHNLQVERGLSIGLLSSSNKNFSKALEQQRVLSDKAISTLNQQIESLSARLATTELDAQLNAIGQQLPNVAVHRNMVDAQDISISQLRQDYTVTIATLLNLPDRIVQNDMASALSNKILAVSNIMHLKEAIGLERALGTQAIEHGSLTNADLQLLVLTVGKQNGFLRTFRQTATPDAWRAWLKMTDSETFIQVKAFEDTLFSASLSKHISKLDSAQWFELLSQKMNKLKTLSVLLERDLQQHVAGKVTELHRSLYITTLMLLALSLLTLILSKLLTRSITQPIEQLTNAMTRLSTGNRDIRLNNKLARDELRQMGAAYELCRLGLLKSDLEDFELMCKRRENEFYKGLASTDSLTETYNRREFFDRANAEIERSGRYNTPLSVLMLDLDHFKGINDQYGHANGDLVLRSFANTCKYQLRTCDILARIGGEEFAILLPETNLSQAYILADRMREATKSMGLIFDQQPLSVTVSIGAAQWNSECVESFSQLLERADKNLYQAKSSGRDKVVCL